MRIPPPLLSCLPETISVVCIQPSYNEHNMKYSWIILIYIWKRKLGKKNSILFLQIKQQLPHANRKLGIKNIWDNFVLLKEDYSLKLKVFTSGLSLYLYMFSYLFYCNVSNRREKAELIWYKFVCGTMHDPKKGLWMVRN